MSEITIRTNNVPRDVLYWHDLTKKEQREFDYLDTETRRLDAQFFRYRGVVYDLHEFSATNDLRLHNPPLFAAWSGYQSDSYFSGIVIRWPRGDRRDSPDFDHVVVGTYYC